MFQIHVHKPVVLKGLHSLEWLWAPVGEEELAVRIQSEIRKSGHKLKWEFLFKIPLQSSLHTLIRENWEKTDHIGSSRAIALIPSYLIFLYRRCTSLLCTFALAFASGAGCYLLVPWKKQVTSGTAVQAAAGICIIMAPVAREVDECVALSWLWMGSGLISASFAVVSIP